VLLRQPRSPRPNAVRLVARRASRFLVPYRRRLLVYMVVLFASALGTVTVPLLTKELINRGVVGGRTGTVVWLGSLAIAVGLIATASRSLGGWLGSTIGLGLVYDLRVALFRHLQQLPLAFFARSQSGAVQSRVNNDVIDAQSLIQNLFGSFASNVVSLVVAVAAMWSLSPEITAVAVLGAPALLLPAKRLGATLRSFGLQQANESARMNAMLVERFNVQGAILFAMAARPEVESLAFEARAGSLKAAVVGRNVTYQKAAFLFGALASLAYGAVYLLGGWQAARGQLSVGSVVALAGLATIAYGPLQSFAQGGVNLAVGLVAFERVFEVLDLSPAISDSPRPTALARPVLGVELSGVSFRHPASSEATIQSLGRVERHDGQQTRDWALRDISFVARTGTMTALVGPTGAGKTTLTLLIPRLYDPQEGVVRVGGVDVRDLKLGDLRSAIGMVTQDVCLLNETLAVNLRIANPDANEAELLDALDEACLGALVHRLPDGLATVMGDRGYRLSGGEKQRVSLARVFLARPDVVILDEATAHLDNQTEAAVQAALAGAAKGRTLIVVAHRLSTVRMANQILVMDHGGIVERGRHADLIERGTLYPSLYRAGLGETGD
jgi:ATP-binding cassette, subfamily B, bacterial